MGDDRGKCVGEAASFVVRITFRKNASYQGEVTWLEGEKTRHFRSALDLMTLIQEAVEASDAPPSDYQLRSWLEEDALDYLEADSDRGESFRS